MAHDRDIEDFLTYITSERRLSANTVSSYRSDLYQWELFATDNGKHQLCPSTASVNDLRLWVSSLAKSHISQRSITRKVQSLRAFFAFMMRRRGMKSNPAADIQLSKAPKPLPVYIPTDEINDIIDTPLDESNFIEVRNRLILALLYNTGMRCSELTGLKDADINTSACELKVLGKRNKERIVPFGRDLATMIQHYRQLTNRDGIADNAPELITDSEGAPLSRNAVYLIVHRALTDGGAHASRLSPHVLRHSFASDMLNGGAPINAVQHLLGHRSLQTTQIYTHLTYSELLTNYQSAHPRALKKGGEHGN